MAINVVDLKRLFNLEGTESLVLQIETFFGEKPKRIMIQLGLFPGFDEVAILMKNGVVYRCLASDGRQVSDWIEVPKGDQI